MALFKILKGDSSRIDLNVTPFHDGYAYFTPDDGGFYIDSDDDGVQQRIRVNPGSTVKCTLLASEWVSDRQTIAAHGIASDLNGVAMLAPNATTEQVQAAKNAGLHICDQGDGSITVVALGSVPTCDIPIVIVVMGGEEEIDPLPAIGTPLNDCSWEDISKIAAKGLASDYFAIGDCKAVTVNGTVGTLEVNTSYYVYIIGFDHNGATNTIDFGTFKTAASDGVDVCLIDNSYDSDSSEGVKCFNLNHWGSSSEPYSTNYGGWKGCDARYDILGSTDTAPSGYGSTATTSRTGYDASTTCATNPVENTLMAALPSDLRAVMKPMTVYTDNVGNSSNAASGVSTSVDYLPLLAEFEVFGSRTYANAYERNYQAQYAYYSAGNSKVRYRHSATSSTAIWWERSPNYYGAFYFCIVDTSGTAGNYNSRFSCGMAPIFRV